MSKVYSFRLDENNPREAQAREVIEAWVSKGYSIRSTLTEALIRFDEKHSPKEMDSILEQLQDMVNQLMQRTLPESCESEEAISLQVDFLESVKKSIKPGTTE
jgi:vacuolar-type H+-ATPase subunit D/Vma8